MKRNTKSAALLFAAGLATASGLAHADRIPGKDNDAVAALAQAKISLVQAIGMAEAHVGGKASKAEVEEERGAVAFEIEVVRADGKVFDVKIDADGKVLSSQQDDDD